MTTPRSNRMNSSGEYWSDLSDGFSSDDDSHVEIPNQPWTTIQHQRQQSELCVLTNDTALLSYLSDHIFTIWKDLGRNLKIKEAIIENIVIDHKEENEREKAYQLLLTWTRQLGSKATLYELLHVLQCMGRNDIVKAIENRSNRVQRRRSSAGSGRAIRLEMKSHAKMQKGVLRELKKAGQYYQQRLKEAEDLQHRDFVEIEAREMKEKLKKWDKNAVQRKLDLLQDQIYICSMLEKDQKYFELDERLRIVADKLFELDKTFKTFDDILDDLRVSYYSKVECAFGGGLCYFRQIKVRTSSSACKRSGTSCKEDKFQEIDDDVFQDSPCQDPQEQESKTSPKHSFTRNTLSRSSFSKLFQSRNKTSSRPHKGQEEHTKRKLSVSSIDIDEQFELQDFVNKFCRRYRHDRPFIYSHCCMNRGLQGSRDENVLRPRPLSSIDPNTLPIPCYQSTEAIKSLVTSPFGSHTPRAFINDVTDWI